MAATYTDPSTSTRDAVRFEVGDTGVTAPFVLTDEEIDYLLTRTSDVVLMAAADAAWAMSARYAARADSETNGDVSVTWSGLSARMAALARSLTDRAQSDGDVPIAAGLVDDAAYTDRGPLFWVGQFDSARSSAFESFEPL